jgi:ABC-type Na+ efflux pump permease subunit
MLWRRRGSSGKVRLSKGLGQIGYGIDNEVLLVAWKELTEALRDRRTILNVILLPMILMPISMALPIMLMAPGGAVRPITVVVVEDIQSLNLIEEKVLPAANINATIMYSRINATKWILENKADLVVVIPRGFYYNLTSSLSAVAFIYYDPFSMKSEMATAQLQLAFDQLAKEEIEKRLKAVNLTPEFARPIEIVGREVSKVEATPASVIGAMILPIMVGVLAVTGAGTFALDMIAGERERKTIEALLTAPITKLKLLMGKYVAMLLLSVLSGISMLISFIFASFLMVNYAIAPSIPSTIPMQEALNVSFSLMPSGLNPIAFLLSLAFAIVLAGLTGDALIVVGASFAKSFKEAQQYTGVVTAGFIIPLISVIYLPPRLFWPFRMLPITSISLLVRDIMVNPGDKAAIMTSSIASVLYLVFFLLLSARLFGREAVVFD